MIISMKKMELPLLIILFGSLVLSGCTKDEILDYYNNIVQSAGSIELTGNLSLKGTKEKGIDDYTGTYSNTLTLPDGGNYIGIECDNFTGSIEMNIE